MNPTQRSTISEDEKINQVITKNLIIHTNLDQEVLVTTEDKIRICLTEYINRIGKKESWIAPLGIFLSIITTLSTSDFKNNALGQSADTWTAIYLIVGVVSLVWFLKTIVYIFKCPTIDDVINELKKGSLKNTNEPKVNEPTIERRELKIIRAFYGIETKKIDVTSKLNELITGGTLKLVVTNALVPTDPVQGTPKHLYIDYSLGKEILSKTIDENDEISLP